MVVLVRAPLVPVTVIGYSPGLVVDDTAKVSVEVPAAVIEAGLKLAVTPRGKPEADKLITDSKLPVTLDVIVVAARSPCTTASPEGLAERVKKGGASALIRLTPFGLPQPVAKSYPGTAG